MPTKRLFSGRDLAMLYIPLFIEQLLTILVGMADTIMVSSAGEAAISGVSLIDVVMILVINVFAALATGGAVVAGQAIGNHDDDRANHAGHQILLFCMVAGVIVMLFFQLAKSFMIGNLFGQIDPLVAENASIYLTITAFSIPFIAVFNASAALFRTIGNSKTPMLISLFGNIINVVGNYILIYRFHLGVVGAAIPTVISRAFCAIMILICLHKKGGVLAVQLSKLGQVDTKMLKRILSLGLPNGLENSMFQLGKIIMVSLISTFGTAQIAANAVCNTLATFQALGGATAGMVLISVGSRCVGARDFEQARYYTRRLHYITYAAMVVINVPLLIFARQVIGLYGTLSPEAVEYALISMSIHGVFCFLLWPLSFTLPNILRAAGDVRFCMVVATTSMWLLRCVGGYFLATTFGLQMTGVWIAMIIDWIVRTIFFVTRYRGTKWYLFRL